jgi:hypothetical protein
MKPTKTVSFIGKNASLNPTSWERSFPVGSVSGTSWMIDVLEDLTNFAESIDLHDAHAILSVAKQKLIKVIEDSH